ncbi:MAG: MaoC/PaaZ C-terminal domain-containing protein [Bacteroidota bacterium]
MSQLSVSDLHPGKKLEFGKVVLREEEIIAFAKAFDPLDFHTDKKAAEKSFFGRLVASGPHIFNLVHRTQWIPLLGHTVICGLEISNWKFLKPVYADMPVYPVARVMSIKPNIEKKHAVIHWRYEFHDEQGTLIQVLDSAVLHKI